MPSEEVAFRYSGNFQRSDILPLDTGTIWKYNATGANLGSAWRATNYDDSAWSEGPPLLGVSAATLAAPVRTPLALGYRTYYFRKKFVFLGNPARTTLRLSHIVDDGAVFFVNGTSSALQPAVYPSGNVPNTAAALQDISNPSYTTPVTLSFTNLVVGENVLAVEVHQVRY